MATDMEQQQPAPMAGSPAASPDLPASPTIPPLNISGLVVDKSDLLAVLRGYLAQAADINLLDGDRFLVSLVAPANGEERRPQ